MTHLTRRRGGFTLIEMVLVLIILATIAGLVISQLGFIGRTSDMAATAKTQQDIANQLNLYFVLQKRMPQRLDSLMRSDGSGLVVIAPVDAAGNPIDPSGTPATTANDQAWGLPYSGANGIKLHEHLTPVALTNTTGVSELKRSFTRLGFDFIMDHNSAVVNCNDSATIERNLDTDCTVATVTAGGNLAKQIYPSTQGVFPPGVGHVVAVGVGPRNSLIPTSMLNAPLYPGCDGKYYGRYIAYFAVFHTGERAQLVGVSDSYGRFPNYSIQQFNESLPDNGRQG